MNATEKLNVLTMVESAIAGGISEASACAAAGVSFYKLARWRRAFRAGGVAELEDKRAGRSGRKPVAAKLTPAAAEHLRKLAVGCGSLASAVDEFELSAVCPPEIKGVLAARRSRHHIPLSLRRAAASTPEQEAMFHGPKQFDEVAFIQRRDMTMIDPRTGERVRIQPGDWWEMDDQSTNQPFWFELPDGDAFTRQGTADALARRHGVGLGRQGLFAVDIATGRWLSCELVGRPRDAYRAEDILRFMRRLFEDYGLPRFGIRLERGCWQSRSITGEKIEMPEDQRRIVVHGLRNLGIHVEYVYKSRGKPFVEGGFDHLQTRMAIEAMKHGWKDIGRFRGDRERETAAMLRCKAGVVHPRESGFPHISELAVAYQDAMGFLNTHAKEGRLQAGIPDELFRAAIAADPLRKLDAKHAGIFLPMKFDTRLAGGHLQKTIMGRVYRFAAPEITARLGNGYRLFVAFDPSDPWRGAELYNLEEGTRNVSGLSLGAHVGTAEWSEDAPQFGLGSSETSEQRKRFTRAFRAAYAAAGLAGTRGRRILEERDGVGGLRREERHAEISERTPAEPRRAHEEPPTTTIVRSVIPDLTQPTDADLADLDARGKAALEELSELVFR